jgi:hypothetical protein
MTVDLRWDDSRRKSSPRKLASSTDQETGSTKNPDPITQKFWTLF